MLAPKPDNLVWSIWWEERINSWEQLSHLLIAHLCCHMCACTDVHTCINKMQLKCFYSIKILISLDAVSHNSMIQKIVVEAGMMNAPIVFGIWMLGSQLVALFGGGLRRYSFMEEVHPWKWALKFQRHMPFSVHSLCFLLVIWDVNSQLSTFCFISYVSSFHALPLWCWYTQLSGAISPKQILLSIKCPGYCLITAIEK